MSLSYHTITTPRLTTAYLSAGTPGKPRLLLLHGNVSSAVFYEHLMERLADDFEMLAPDFRCFGHSSALPIDATRGMRDFSDDIAEFLHAVGWDRFIFSAGPWVEAWLCSMPLTTPGRCRA